MIKDWHDNLAIDLVSFYVFYKVMEEQFSFKHLLNCSFLFFIVVLLNFSVYVLFNLAQYSQKHSKKSVLVEHFKCRWLYCWPFYVSIQSWFSVGKYLGITIDIEMSTFEILIEFSQTWTSSCGDILWKLLASQIRCLIFNSIAKSVC